MEQLKERVAILAAPVDEQREWAHDHGYPIDELMQSFTDVVPMYFGRLRSEGVMDDRDELVLLRLRVYFDATMVGRKELFQEWDAVANAPEWQRVRELARQVLETLDGTK